MTVNFGNMEPLEFQHPKRVHYTQDDEEKAPIRISCLLYGSKTVSNNRNTSFKIEFHSYQNQFLQSQTHQTTLKLSSSMGTLSETSLVWSHSNKATINDLKTKLSKLCGFKLNQIG